MTGAVDEALERLKRGEIVLVFDADNREMETDMVVASEKVGPGTIRTFRRDAGGLICTTVGAEVSEKLGLPFLADVFSSASSEYPVLSGLSPNDIPYDNKSSFSITINHRETFTGVTDNDRARTINELTRLIDQTIMESDGWARKEMGNRFRAPGHVILLRASPHLLDTRTGHTELSTAMLEMAGMTPSATICEMMGDDGNALSKREARDYADRHGLLFLEGKEVIDFWKGK